MSERPDLDALRKLVLDNVEPAKRWAIAWHFDGWIALIDYTLALEATLREREAELAGAREVLERIRWRGCADPGYGGCFGELCASCTAKAALARLGGGKEAK